jgi:hypothetical protein
LKNDIQAFDPQTLYIEKTYKVIPLFDFPPLTNIILPDFNLDFLLVLMKYDLKSKKIT